MRPLHAAVHVGDFRQRASHPGIAVTCPPTEAPTATLGIARTYARPGGEVFGVFGAGEAREVCADLGDEHFGGAPGDTGPRRGWSVGVRRRPAQRPSALPV